MFTPQNISILIAVIIAIVIIFVFTFKTKSNNKNRSQQPSLVKSIISYFDDNYELALSELREIASKDNCPPEVFLTIGLIYKKHNDYTKAAQILEVLLLHKDIDNQYKKYIKTELAKNYLLAQMPIKAITTLQEEDTNNEDNAFILAYSNLLAGNIDNAIGFANKYKKLHGSAIYGFVAKCHIAKAIDAKDYNKSIKFLKNAINDMPNCRPARFMLANFHAKNKRHDKAIEEYKNIINDDIMRNMNDFEAIKHEFIVNGDESKLLDIFCNARLKHPNSTLINVAIASLYDEKGEHLVAVKELKSFIEENKSAVAVAEYAKLTNDNITELILKDIKPYQCVVCNTPYYDYREECGTCFSFDSINIKK